MRECEARRDNDVGAEIFDGLNHGVGVGVGGDVTGDKGITCGLNGGAPVGCWHGKSDCCGWK